MHRLEINDNHIMRSNWKEIVDVVIKQSRLTFERQDGVKMLARMLRLYERFKLMLVVNRKKKKPASAHYCLIIMLAHRRATLP